MDYLKIAVQKSGRLHEDSLQLLKECGISIDNGKDQLKAKASNFPIEILYLRNADIPQYLKDGVADIAIIGDNTLIEKDACSMRYLDLGFSKCRLSIAIPKNETFTDVSYLNGKRIATSYPKTVQDFLDKHNLSAHIHEISGSVEIAPNIGLADAICDIVSSGSTLFKNGLKEVHQVLKSQAVLAASPNLSADKVQVLEQLCFRIKAVLAAKHNKYILLNAPKNKLDEICGLLPGMKSPTILPLHEADWYSVHSVITEAAFWENIDKLKAAGAQGILIIPIEKMIL